MAWRPTLEQGGSPRPPPKPATRGFALTLSAFSAPAKATVAAAQRLAIERGHGSATEAHLGRALARSEPERASADAELARLASAAGARAGLAPALLALIDRAEGLGAQDGGREVTTADLREARSASHGTDASKPATGGAPPDVDGGGAAEPSEAPLRELDADATEVLEAAGARAARRGRSVGVLDLLDVLAGRPEVARALAITGVRPDALRASVEAASGEDHAASALALSSALSRADGEARRAGRERTAPMDLMLGVLATSAPPVGELKGGLRLYATVLRSAAEAELTPEEELRLRAMLGAAPAWSIRAARRAPLTAAMVLGAIAVTLAAYTGDWVLALVLRMPIAPTELWRAFTTVLPHVGVLHLVFNVAWMWMLGSPLEQRRGPWRTAAFYLLAAYVSSLANVAWSDPGVGLSGLLYAVAAYHWVVQRAEPESPIVLSTTNARLLVGWLVACVLLTELDVLPVANMAHGMGLLCGLLVGWLAVSRRRVIPLALIAALVVGVTAGALAIDAPLFPHG